ncbi:MAG: translocation/assembly module TamB domain-containing protein [Minicystis sp.]
MASVAKAAGLGAVFVLAAAGAVIVHLNLAAPKRLVTARVNDMLAGTFQGKITVQRVGKLGLTRLGGVDAEVLDPEGKRVLDIHGLNVGFGTFALLRSLPGSGPLVVRIPELGVDGAEAVVEQDENGEIGIQRAFASRAPQTNEPSRGTDLQVSRIRLGHAWVHGHLQSVPVLDADLVDLAGSLASAPKGSEVEVQNLLLRARGLGGVNPEGVVTARATLPADPEADKEVRARYDGRVGEVPIRADASLEGKNVVAVVNVPETAPEAFAALAPGKLHLGAPASVHVEVNGRLPVLSPEIRAQIGDGEISANGTVTLPEGPGTNLVASVSAAARNLDASALQAGSAKSRLSADMNAAVTAHAGQLAGSFDVDSHVGEVSGQVVPAARIHGDFTENSVRGTARIAERGAPTHVRFSLQPRPGGDSPSQLAVQAETTIADLGAVQRMGRVGRGRAHLLVDGAMDLDSKRISAQVSGEAAGIVTPGVRLARGSIAVTAVGPLASPDIVADVTGAGVRAGDYGFTGVHASVRGTPQDLSLDTKVTGDQRSPSATVTARLTGGERENARLRGQVLATLGDAGRLDIKTGDVILGGPSTSPAAWKAATGDVALAANVDLGRLLSKLPEKVRPAQVQSMSGQVAIRGNVSRGSARATPGVEIEASTQGLTLVAKSEPRVNPDGSTSVGKAPWQTAGLDAALALRLQESTGNTKASLKLHNPSGPVATIDANAHLPIAAIMKSPGRFVALSKDAPVEVKIDVPRRSLDALPPALGRVPVTGEIELAAALHGTPRAPRLTVNAKGQNLLPRGSATCVRSVDLEAKVDYDGRKADVRLAATREGREVMGTDAIVKVNAADAFAGRPIAWEASGDVALDKFPLDQVGLLLQKPITGELSGKVAVKDLHRAASLEANLDLHDLSLDRTDFPRGKVHVVMRNGSLVATARLDQEDGHFETRATGAMTWGTAIAPALDLTRPVDVELRAQNFRANAALPFVQGIFSELDGRVDTDAKIHVAPGAKDGTMNGAIVLRDGVVEVPQIGERFHALKGSIIMKPWGTIRFDDFAAQGPTGSLTASAQAVLRGLQLDHAKAEIHIPRGESLPITVEGVPMGRASGDVFATAQMSRDNKRLDLHVDLPTLRMDLPRSTGHAVQRLEPDKTIRVGVNEGGELVPVLLGPPEKPRDASNLAIRAVVKLGEGVQIRRDTTVDIMVEGTVIADVRDKTRMGGQIRLTRGRIELQGKQFSIDRGTVSFPGGDPSNPMILATAFWDAPDGTRVFAEYSGRVSAGKLDLRSEPSLTQDEILALILFGSPDGSFGAEPPSGQETSTGTKVAGMAGGVVTQGLNKAISGITSADITTRVDTSAAGNPRPELAVQLSKSVSARIGYNLGVPAPGQNPDRTELTLDWRFVRDWSLTAVVGDQGSTSLDVVWRKRY